jgi:anaerobic selenocysteine-containing dehydrogenase
MHPADATSRDLATGDIVQLGAEAGTVTVPVEVTDEIRRGVVSLPHGWGHDREGSRLQVAHERAGVSINDVTSDRHLDTLSGTAAFNGLCVSVLRVADPEIEQTSE